MSVNVVDLPKAVLDAVRTRFFAALQQGGPVWFEGEIRVCYIRAEIEGLTEVITMCKDELTTTGGGA